MRTGPPFIHYTFDDISWLITPHGDDQVIQTQGYVGYLIYDYIFGKRVLPYWEPLIRGTPDYSPMTADWIYGRHRNYTFSERGNHHLTKNVWFSIGTISPSIWL